MFVNRLCIVTNTLLPIPRPTARSWTRRALVPRCRACQVLRGTTRTALLRRGVVLDSLATGEFSRARVPSNAAYVVNSISSSDIEWRGMCCTGVESLMNHS